MQTQDVGGKGKRFLHFIKFLRTRRLNNARREFPQTWCKCSLEHKDELIVFWWSKVERSKGHAGITNCDFSLSTDVTAQHLKKVKADLRRHWDLKMNRYEMKCI